MFFQSEDVEVRRKAILVPAKGTGYCAEDTDEERFEYRPCLYGGAYVGLPACPPNLVRGCRVFRICFLIFRISKLTRAHVSVILSIVF